jgi:tetratricopeptide (TPR) repeat protein
MIPKEKAPEIVNSLRSALYTGVDEFTLRKHETEAKRLLEFDQEMARVALGFVAALRQNHADVLHHFTLAIAAATDISFVYGQWCDAFLYMGQITEAYVMIKEQVRKHPDIANLKYYAMHIATRLARIREAVDYFNEIPLDMIDDRDATIIKQLIDFDVLERLDKRNISDDDLQKSSLVFLGTLYHYRLLPRWVSITPSEDFHDDSIPLLTFRVTTTGNCNVVAEAICDTVVKLNTDEAIRDDIFSIILYTVENVD